MYPANITRDEARARSALIRTHSYEILVDLSGRNKDPQTTFVSTSTIRFSSKSGTTHVDFIAEDLLSAVLDGMDLDCDEFTKERLPLHLVDGEHVLTIIGRCRYSRTGEGLHQFFDPVDGLPYCYTHFESADARRVFACFEQPDLKATFTMSVIAPARWTVLSNSAAVDPVPVNENLSRWDFAATPRISTYVTAFVAGYYHTVHDVYRRGTLRLPLSVSCRPSLVPYLDAERIFSVTKNGFDAYGSHFGEPYPFADYAQVFVPEFNFGAMENAGCVIFRDEYLFRSRVTQANRQARDNTILHEMAHMWFGDLVTMRWWDDLWLNESFAEWASHWCQEQIGTVTGENHDPWVTFNSQRKTWAYRQDQLPSTHPIAADMVDLEAVDLLFDGITYAKGASALRQLVAFVGEGSFLVGVRNYFAKHAWGNTELPDLLVELEEASGRDLHHFVRDWLEQAGVNTLRVDATVNDDGDYETFTVVQSADPRWPTLRQHRIAIGRYDLVNGVLTRSGQVECDIAGARTPIPALVGRRRPALLLLNDQDLTYAKIRLDAFSLATLTAHLELLVDPLARSLCWGAAWDMCRDAELAVSGYLTLVERGIAVESDLTAVNVLANQSQTAIWYYTDRNQRATVLASHHLAAERLLAAARPGSDHQLVFARMVIDSAAEADAPRLREWLAGIGIPAGLVIDTDVRWRLTTKLAQLGVFAEVDIERELVRDNTIAGQEWAAGATAGLPTAAAKANSWRRATEPDGTPNETHRKICSSFWQFDQDDVLSPYLTCYLELLDDIATGRKGWDRQSSTIRRHAVSLLFPSPLADATFIARLDEWLAQRTLPDTINRLVLESRDAALRALRCQGYNATSGMGGTHDIPA